MSPRHIIIADDDAAYRSSTKRVLKTHTIEELDTLHLSLAIVAQQLATRIAALKATGEDLVVILDGQYRTEDQKGEDYDVAGDVIQALGETAKGVSFIVVTGENPEYSRMGRVETSIEKFPNVIFLRKPCNLATIRNAVDTVRPFTVPV